MCGSVTAAKALSSKPGSSLPSERGPNSQPALKGCEVIRLRGASVRSIPRRTASTRYGRSRAAGTMACTEPTSRARSMLCTSSNSSASCPSLSACTAGQADASFARSAAASSCVPLAVASAIAACRSATRGSAAVRLLTSAANTTAAAGAPPITEA